MDRGELLQSSQVPEAKHRSLAPSKWLVRILRAIVPPAAGVLSFADAELAEGRTIGPEPIGHDFIGATVPLQRFLQEFQCRTG